MKALPSLAFGLICVAFSLTSYAGLNNPFAPGQVWKGSYTCSQGKTALTLRIKDVSFAAMETDLGEAYSIDAVFDFNYRNRTAAGAFYLTGAYYPETDVATFDPGEWIRRPRGYMTVGMDGTVTDDGQAYSGRILFKGCKSFSLRLIADPAG